MTTDLCPRHHVDLYPEDAPVQRCLHPGCGFTLRHPAPAPTYDTGSRTELDAARYHYRHADQPDRRMSPHSGDEFDADTERD